MPIIVPSKKILQKSKLAKAVDPYSDHVTPWPQNKNPRYDRRKDKFCPSVDDCQKWFDIINKEVFDSQLPNFHKITIRRIHGAWAQVVNVKIGFPNKELGFPTREVLNSELEMNNYVKNHTHFLNVLGHEMVHLYQAYAYGEMPHGPTFYEWRPKFKEFGLFLESRKGY